MDSELNKLLINYKGTLSTKDQKIFFKLQNFDHVNFNLINQENGFIEFGKSRLKSKNNEELNDLKEDELDNNLKDDNLKDDNLIKSTKLTNDRPIFKFLNQFKKSLIKTSIFNFPLDLKLDDYIEYDQECLDPRFLLLSIYQLINLRKINLEELIDSNCLAILFVSLSFYDYELRKLAYTILVKFRQVLCSNVHGTIWRIILDKLSSSLTEDNQFIDPLITSFFVHLIKLIKKSTYSIHDKLIKFLSKESSFKINNIVGFIYTNMLMTDDQESSSFYQEIALLIIKNGLRTEQDFSLCLKGGIIDFLLMNFNSSILFKSNLKMKVLDIFILISKLELASKFLLTEKAFNLWLNQLIIDNNNNNIEFLNKINQIINQLMLHNNYYEINKIELKMIKNICTRKIDLLL